MTMRVPEVLEEVGDKSAAIYLLQQVHVFLTPDGGADCLDFV